LPFNFPERFADLEKREILPSGRVCCKQRNHKTITNGAPRFTGASVKFLTSTTSVSPALTICSAQTKRLSFDLAQLSLLAASGNDFGGVKAQESESHQRGALATRL
jgi:hypothetical protein